MTAPCATFRIKCARLNLKLFHSNVPLFKFTVYVNGLERGLYHVDLAVEAIPTWPPRFYDDVTRSKSKDEMKNF